MSPVTHAVDGAVEAQAMPCCADCGQSITGNYCAHCGQETLIETPTVRHFLREFIDQYVALEGKLGRTLRVLVMRPGQLTLDYVEGRRQRYVRPLKLYLSISVVFFTLLGVLPDSSNPFVNDEKDKVGDIGDNTFFDDADDEDALKKKMFPNGVPKGPERPTSTTKPDDAASAAKDAAQAPNSKAFENRIEQKAKAFSKLGPKERKQQVRKKLADDAPYAMFFLLPYFALLLRIFYRKQKMRYGVHLLFSLHVHSFLFILLAFGFLPFLSALSLAFEIAIGVYIFFALRRVYGGTPARTLWRMFWLWAFYLLAVVTTAVSGVMAAVFSGTGTGA